MLTRYERITFDTELIRQAGAPPAELLAPGHPLLAATIDLLLERHAGLFTQGTVLVDDADTQNEPRVLVMLEHAIADGRPTRNAPHTVVSRRFEFVEIDGDNNAVVAGYAPYLDYRPPAETELKQVDSALEADWLTSDLESIGTNHAIGVAIPEHLARVRLHTEARVDATLAAVMERLTREVNHWYHRANEFQLKAETGKMPQANVDRARNRADRLAQRLESRTAQLEAERSLRALPPTVVGGALIVPARLLTDTPSSLPEQFVISRAEVERRAVEAVLEAEAQLGWQAVDLNETHRNHPGYDIRSRRAATDGGLGDVKFIEVKGRIQGAPTVTVSRNEILTALNEPKHFVLALVEVSPDGTDTVRYLRHPFEGRSEEFIFDVTSVNFTWAALWNRSVEP